MTAANLPLISLMIITLPVGAAMIWLWPNVKYARWIALFTALVDLLLSLKLLLDFDSSKSGFQFVERTEWMSTVNVQYLVGVDGISILFLPLTVLLFIGLMITTWNAVSHMQRLYYSLLLLLESATLGIFCSLDGILFFLFWELTLIPLYFLISYWGVGANRRYAATKYTLFMLAGGVPLLFAFILLAFNQADSAGAMPEGLSFDYMIWLETPLAPETQTVVFLLLLLGFAVKTPIVPLHTWLPVVAMQGSASVVATLVGLKLGAYGLIRFVIPLAPQAAQEYAWLLTALGSIGVLYGAIVAIAQTNLRRMLAFASVSHVGLVILGIASLTEQGLQGAVFQLLNFTLVAGGLFLLTGLIYQRIGATDVISLGGASKTMPMLASTYLLFGLAAMGLPGTSGFPAEFLILYATITTHTGAGIAALVAVIIGAAYFLSLYRQTFLGPICKSDIAQAYDLQPREIFFVAIVAVLILVAGLYPAIVLDVMQVSVGDWIGRVSNQ